jgi:hypothetical protein
MDVVRDSLEHNVTDGDGTSDCCSRSIWKGAMLTRRPDQVSQVLAQAESLTLIYGGAFQKSFPTPSQRTADDFQYQSVLRTFLPSLYSFPPSKLMICWI